jgi:hypothetical protein
MGGKSSGNGASFANKASRDFVGTGSMTSRSPSFRMMASSPGNSNSRGIRTALLRPFLKTLTWRSGLVLAGSGGICQAYAKGGRLSTSVPTFRECDGDFATVEMRGYFLPRANSPNVSGCTAITSWPFVFPVMIGLFGTVSYA